MIRFTLLGLIAATCFAQSIPELGLFVRYDLAPAPAFVEGMRTELDSILAPADLRVQWLREGQPHGSQTWLRAIFIHFHGACSTGSNLQPAAQADSVPLAQTSVSDGVILPYTDTDCDRLRAFLENGSFNRTEESLGIAMARVIAHELYHVLLQTPEHSKTGIARAAHTASALLGPSLQFEDGELDRIRRRYSITRSISAQKTNFSASWSVLGPKP